MTNVHFALDNLKDVCLALGFFDGVHCAHQKLILKTIALAKKNGNKSALITYLKSPYSIIKNAPVENIFSLEERINQIKTLGVDEIFVLNFEDFKNITAEDYIQNVLIRCFAPKFVISGFNHTFGLNKKGNPKLLYKNFNYVEIPPQSLDGLLISSTNIKQALKSGKIELANKMLGKNFYINGKVIKGAQIARQLGYNTANIIWGDEIVRPKYGVYSGFVHYGGKKYSALINFGIRPTVDKELKETLEAHLDGFEGDLYGKNIRVEFAQLLRFEKKFSCFEELKNQIAKDFLEHNKRTGQNKNSAN